jgi:succinoglycan biosynthesis transport protein ExoP
VFPRTGLNLALAFLISVLMAFAWAIVSDSLDKTVRDPELAARLLNTEVIGSLPHVRHWRPRRDEIPSAAVLDANGMALVHAQEHPASAAYHEAVRALRNSIALADFEHKVRSVLITSATPGEGKSTIAAHLALTHAAQKRKTLLIDGDLRRPSVHKRFQMSGAVGLSSVLIAGMPWRDAVLRLPSSSHLDILPAGLPSTRATDLVGAGLARLLSEASAEYDLVILDAPPLLGFGEPLEMAAAVDGVVVVVRAGQTPRKAVASVLGILTRLRAKTLGVVLNEVRQDTSESYYYYAQYAKYYRAAAEHARSGA